MAQWYIKARVNSSLLVADTGIENDFENLQAIKRFNDVGMWALTLRRESSHLNTFLPVLSSGVLGFPNGLLVQVDNQDGNGLQTVLSGPQLDINVKGQADSSQPVLVTGACDNWWLSKRQVLPCPHYPYIFFVSNGNQTAGPAGQGLSSSETSTALIIASGQVGVAFLRYYPLSESAGTTATDFSVGASNGTYNGGFTLGQNSLIDDPNTCTKFNGTTGFVSVPTAGLPTGNTAWSVFGWGYLTAHPGANITMWSFGTNLNKEGCHLDVTSTGQVAIVPYGVAQTTSAANVVPLNQPFFLAMTWDGTTLKGWCNGVQVCSTAPGALSTTYGGCWLGSNLGTGQFWPNLLAHGLFMQGNLSTAMHQQVYAVGVNRNAFQNFDDNGGFWSFPGSPNAPIPGPAFTHASTGLIYYVQRNANASALPVAANGACAPTTTFTSVTNSHSARQITNLSIAADPAVGSSVYGPARLDSLLDFLAALALQSTTEIGLKLEQSGSNLVFTVYQPTDLTSTAIFSRDLYGAQGNILDYEWKVSKAVANHIIAGGANPAGGSLNLAERLLGENENTASISADGYLEDFLDYRQSTTGPTLQQAITGKLATDAQVFQVQATLLDQPGVLYFKGPTGKGYDLGNKVTVIVDGQVFQQVIRQIQIDLAPGQPAKITPAVGTPIRTEIISEYDAINQRLQSLNRATVQLKANY